MYTHRISGIVHGVKRHCHFIFQSRLPQDVLICLQGRLGLQDHSLISDSGQTLAVGEFPAHFDVFREAGFSCENAGGMGARFSWTRTMLSLFLPGVLFSDHHNAGRSCENNGRFRENKSSTRKELGNCGVSLR